MKIQNSNNNNNSVDTQKNKTDTVVEKKKVGRQEKPDD
jgi:hypothetical protein